MDHSHNTLRCRQSGIDGGGFKVAKRTDDYLWVQFESGQNAFIDDFEVHYRRPNLAFSI